MYLLAEKILAGDEELREDWPIHGTTGYDFTTHVTQLLVNSRSGEKRRSPRRTRSSSGGTCISRRSSYEKKRLTMRLSLANDINVLGSILNRLSERNRLFRDFTLNALTGRRARGRRVLPGVPHLPRSHGHPPGARGPRRGQPRRQPWPSGRTRASRRRSSISCATSCSSASRRTWTRRWAGAEHEHFVMKFQQCTGPIMAKGLEDTAFYIYNRLVALNEVGGEPQHFGIDAGGVSCDQRTTAGTGRTRCWPRPRTTPSAARTPGRGSLALSELPGEWRRALANVEQTQYARTRRSIEGENSSQAPDANEEYLLYQVLLGTWPVGAGPGPRGAAMGRGAGSLFGALSDEEHKEYVARIQDYMTKAIKEAKVNSSWVQPNEPWDEAVRAFIARLLERGGARAATLSSRRSRRWPSGWRGWGAMNSLAQIVLKLTTPGVPDIYQGCDIWDFSLVDPDNRRPVDYTARRAALATLAEADPCDLLAHWPDGRVKLFVIRAILRYRQEHAELFGQGSYRPLKVSGPKRGQRGGVRARIRGPLHGGDRAARHVAAGGGFPGRRKLERHGGDFGGRPSGPLARVVHGPHRAARRTGRGVAVGRAGGLPRWPCWYANFCQPSPGFRWYANGLSFPHMINEGKKNVLGIRVDAVDYEGAEEAIIRAAHEKRPFAVSALAVHGIMTGVTDREHKYRLNRFDLIHAGRPARALGHGN